jgi:predicted nucleic acid-binding protein
MTTTFTALFDACVLYPAPLRDLLMWLALTDLFRARWSDEIHDEWIRNVLADRPDLRPEQLERTRQLMNARVRDCLVTGYENLIEKLTLPDQDDRHVLAAAIWAGADVIVTFNLADFPADVLSRLNIEARHPDDFVLALMDLDEEAVCAAVERQRAGLRKPPKSIAEHLETLRAQGLPKSVARLQAGCYGERN